MDATAQCDKFRDKAVQGQMTLLKTLKGYRMDVYPTHRSCGFPDYVWGARKPTPEARLAANGWGPGKSHRRGGAVPHSQNGAEAMWNHKLRYMGEGMIEHYSSIFSSKDSNFTPLVQDQ
ncbi:MAG: DUF1329 domain-containing protein [Rhodocyclaceae bacterium]|nr:DUF1329 domain-containing protein [Rhodocyclaceae bacterium]